MGHRGVKYAASQALETICRTYKCAKCEIKSIKTVFWNKTYRHNDSIKAPISQPPIVTLSSSNASTGFVFAHMDPGIEYLYLSYNRLDGEAIEPESFFGSYQSMVELCLDHNQLLSVPSGINEMTSLHFLRLNDNDIRYEASGHKSLARGWSVLFICSRMEMEILLFLLELQLQKCCCRRS